MREASQAVVTRAHSFDPYSVDPADEFLALGGRRSAARHDPEGHEDCARDWNPCECHGDRLCRLGMLVRWSHTSAEHLEWMRGNREDRDPDTILRISGCRDKWELAGKIRSSERTLVEFASEIWPLILANARA